MTGGQTKSYNYRLAALENVGWCDDPQDVFAEFEEMCLTMYRVHQSEVVVAGILNVSSSMVSTTLRGAGMKRGQGGRVYVKYRVIVGGRSMPLVDAAKLKGIKYQSIISKSREGGISPCEAFSQMEAA